MTHYCLSIFFLAQWTLLWMVNTEYWSFLPTFLKNEDFLVKSTLCMFCLSPSNLIHKKSAASNGFIRKDAIFFAQLWLALIFNGLKSIFFALNQPWKMKLDEIGHALREEQQHCEAQNSATFTTSFLKTAKKIFSYFRNFFLILDQKQKYCDSIFLFFTHLGMHQILE